MHRCEFRCPYWTYLGDLRSTALLREANHPGDPEKEAVGRSTGEKFMLSPLEELLVTVTHHSIMLKSFVNCTPGSSS